MCQLWGEVARASTSFMAEQRSPRHFEFVGVDVICDAYGECYLLEVNRLPGLETSKNRCKPDEDVLYNEMMLGVLELAMESVFDADQKSTGRIASEGAAETSLSAADDVYEEPAVVSHDAPGTNLPTASERPTRRDLWRLVSDPSDRSQFTNSNAIISNLFAWRAFTKKNRRAVII